MVEDNKQEIMIRASNNAHLTKDMLTDTWYMNGLMGVYNLGLEHMLTYLEENDKTKALAPNLWGDGYSDGELVYEDENICIFKAIETVCINEYGSYTLSRFDPIHIVSEKKVKDDVIEVIYYYKEIKYVK